MRRKTAGKIFLIMCVLGICFFLSGCNIKVQTSTEMRFDTNFAGYRLISCTVEQNDTTNEAIAWLDEYLAQGGCPEVFQYVRMENDSGQAVYQFRMDFQSFDDYYTKVCEILGSEPEYVYEKPDNVMASGIIYKESWYSSDLVRWSTDALVAAGIITEDNASGLFSMSGNDVYYNEELLTSQYDNILVDNLQNHSLENIIIHTIIKADNKFDRSFSYVFPYYFYKEKEDELKQEFSKFIPENSVADWYCNDEEQIAYLKVSFSADNMEEMITLTNQTTGSEQADFTGEQYKGERLLSYKKEYIDSIDLSGLFYNTEVLSYQYTVSSYGSSKILDAENVMEGYTINGEGVTTFTDSERTQGVIQYYMELEESYTLDAMELTLETVNKNKYRWMMRMVMGKQIPAELVEGVYEYFNGWEYGGQELTRSNEQENTEINLLVQCSLEEMNTYLEQFWGADNLITCNVEDLGFAREERNYMVMLNMLPFRAKIGYYGLIDFYYIPGKGEKLIDFNYSSDDSEINITKNYNDKGEIVSVEMPDHPFRIGYYARLYSTVRYSNVVLLIVIIILVMLSVAAILSLLLYYFYQHQFKKEIKYDDPKELIKAAALFYGKLIIHLLHRLLEAAHSVDGGILPEGSRREAAIYFLGTKWPALILLAGVLADILFHSRMILGFMFLLAFVVLVVDRFRDRAVRDSSMDVFLEQDLENVIVKGMARLGFDGQETALIKPIIIQGPYMEQPQKKLGRNIFYKLWKLVKAYFVYNMKQRFRTGYDEKVRYSLVQVSCYYFTQQQCLTYTVVIDLITGKEMFYKTSESFYQDVNCLMLGQQNVYVKKKWKKDKVQLEYFTIVSRSGSGEKAFQVTGENSLSASSRSAEQLIRERKYIS